MKVLSLGSGFEKRNDDIFMVDIATETNPDLVWDLNNTPLPLDENTYDKIIMFDVIEHIDDIMKTMAECYRLLKPGGVLHLKTPHFSSANSYTDPTHKFHLGYFSFDFFDPDHERFYYSKAKFKTRYKFLHFHRHRFVNWLFEKVANKYTWNYEQKWAWIFPACYIDIKLEKV